METPLAIRRSVYISVMAVLAGLFIGLRSSPFSARTDHLWYLLAPLGLVVTILVFYHVTKTRRFLADAYSSFELTIEGDSITKRQKNTPDVTLLRSQVKRVEEYSGKGFRISTEDRSLNIWVPVELEGYEQVRAEILSLPVDYRKEQRSWMRSYLGVALLLGLFLVQGIVPNKFIAAGAAFLISTWLFRIFYVYYWSPNLTKKGRQQILLSSLIGIAMLIRGFMLLRR